MQAEVEELKRAADYYKKLSDQVAGYNIQADSRIVLMKREIQQKNDGFTILSSLHKVIGKAVDLNELLSQTLQLILTTLKMDKAITLQETGNGSFRVKWHQGYSKKEQNQLIKQLITSKTLNDSPRMLIHKYTRLTPDLMVLKENLKIPYFLGVKMKAAQQEAAWLIAGRESEAQPFYPPLNEEDLNTFQAIGGFLEAAVANIELYGKLEGANRKLEVYNNELERKVELRTRDIQVSNQELKKEKQKSDDLLLNILPANIANELKLYGRSKARIHNNLTVLFTDFVNFTEFAARHTPEDLVREIDFYFRKFDEIIIKYNLEKIKTIGDAYLCTGGMEEGKNQAEDVIKAALEIRDFVRETTLSKQKAGQKILRTRLGIHHGAAVAGVVGMKKFAFDIWGDTVNIASRMEHHSEPGKVNVSSQVFQLCKDQFNFEYRGKSEVKNKGKIDMYFVEYN